MTLRHLLPSMLITALMALTASCDLEDICDGGDCDTGSSTLVFRYLYDNADQFDNYISTMRYFLFDGSGSYLGEMECYDGDLSRVDVSDLSAGDYSIVGLGNLVDYATIDGYTDGGLDNFRLTVSQLYDDTLSANAFANGDRLYWGQLDFEVVSGQSASYTVDMSNIHCLLTVRVEWEGLPEYSSGYVFKLSEIGNQVMMNSGGDAYSIGVHTFPEVTAHTAEMREDVKLRRFMLQTTLVTLRYGNEYVPVFTLLNGQEVIFSYDLQAAFDTWGWHPDNAQVQEYAVMFTINNDGTTVEVTVGFDSHINDWEDGGTLG